MCAGGSTLVRRDLVQSRTIISGSSSHGRRSSRRVCRSPRWSDDVGERRIVTAVAGSSNKVGGSETQIVTVRPLERSVHLRTAISCSAVAHSAATKKNSRIARIELVTATTRTGRTSNTGLPRSRSRSPLRARAVASPVQRSPRARNSCRRAFLLRELRTRSLSFSFGWYRDVMQLGASTPSARCLT